MTGSWLLYGATGYTGRLIAGMAAARGMRPVLAGRTAAKVAALAVELGLPWRAFALADADAWAAALHETGVVLNCAGPYSQTCRPVAEACLAASAHYLDISGDLDALEWLAARDAAAQAAGVMLLPSVGFDVVPSDCLALHLKQRLPTATHLTLAFQSFGGASRGTMISTFDTVDRPGRVRRGGELSAVPAAWKSRRVDFGAGSVSCVTLPWGDLATAYRSTGIPNIETYMALPPGQQIAMKAARYLGRVLGSRPGKASLRWLARFIPAGPTAAQRAAGYSLLWGEVTDAQGGHAAAAMRTPHSYTLTALTALAVVERVLAGEAPSGFQTPAQAYGADFALMIEGVSRWDGA